MAEIFPWQTAIWQFLVERYRHHRLPHAFLLSGAKGIGKSHFARMFAELLLCQSKEADHACGHCKPCALMKADTNPDLMVIVGEGKHQTIKIDQIRQLIVSINKTAHFNGYRIVIIEAAHQMNQASSNALLKTLEEPPGKVIFILLTDSLSRISATIRSRSELIHFHQPRFTCVKPWLEAKLAHESNKQFSSELLFRLAQETPLAALGLLENDTLIWREKLMTDLALLISGKTNPLGLSEKYQTLELSQLLFWLKTIIIDLIRLKAGAIQRITHADKLQLLQTIVTHLTVSRLYAYLDKLYILANQVASGMNLNHALAVDEIFTPLV